MLQLFVLFLLVPMAEIWLLLQAGELIGVWPTIAACIFTAVLGSYLLRQQGLSTIGKLQRATYEGRVPAIEMIEGMILLVAGALLLTPGFMTDMVGFLVFWPTGRRGLAERLMAGLMEAHPDLKTPPGQKPGARPDVIEGEYQRLDD